MLPSPWSAVIDSETAEAIDTLRVDIYHVESSLHSKIDKVESSLHSRIDRFESSLRSRIDRFESSLRGEMRELHGDAKRHADIIGETLRDDIRMLAEAIVSLGEKIDRA